MKMNFNKTVILLVVATILIVPNLVSAQNSTSSLQLGNIFCTKILPLSEKVIGRISDRITNLQSKRDEIENRLAEHWAQQNANLAQKRDQWDAYRNELFAKLEEKFGSTNHDAVLAFEQAVDAAISARRAAIDSAISSFQQGMESAKSSRQAAIDAAKIAYKNSVIAAYEKAKSDCNSGVSSVTVRQNLYNDLIAAKDKYKTDYAAIEKLSTTIDQLIATRKAAIEKAIADFKAAMEKARADFKSVVGDLGDSKESACLSSGGTVETSSCCKSSGNFPSSCLIGACGCSPDNSKEVKVCNCGEGKCFDGTSCKATQ